MEMKKDIEGFSKYYEEDGNIYNKQTGRKMKVNKDGCVQLMNDNGKNTTVGLKKIIKGKQDYKQIEAERNVKYKPVYSNSNYMFCEDVEDEFKVYSLYNNYFLSPAYVDGHLRFNIRINGKNSTEFFYHLVWEYVNKKRFPKGKICHHKDGCSSNNSYDNLRVMGRKEHTEMHRELRASVTG